MTVIATVKWNELKEAGLLKTGEVIPGKDSAPDRLKLIGAAGPQSLPLCEITSPPITTPSYAVRGTIRYQNVIGVGYLEMWNHFDGAGQYFTRTMDTTGPMGMVTGTSPEREFILPFHTLGKTSAPSKLVVNLVLNGPGEVEIGPLELVPIDAMSGMGTGWWGNSAGALIGSIGGALLGLLGAIMGTLVGIGKGKNLVMVLAASMTAMGLLVLVGGIVAAVNSQPYEVYYPLLLLGGMMSVAGPIVLVVAPSRFRDRELRRMQALDVT